MPEGARGPRGHPASDLVNIAQIFQRSGTLSVSWKESNITQPADFKGKKVGAWDFGNEFEVTAAATKAGLAEGTDYTKVVQDFNMALLLSKEIDVAEAMIYNEYAQVLEAKNPETGELYKPTDFNVINYNDVGTAMLQDALFARASWLAEAGNEDIATSFLKASFQGWMYCRDQSGRLRPVHGQRRLDPRRRPPGLDDERDQPAGLAVAERHRDAGSCRMAADRRCRAGSRHHQGRPAGRRIPNGPRDRGPGRDHRRRQGRGLHQGRSPGHRGRQLAVVGSRRLEGPAREGRPFEFETSVWRRPAECDQPKPAGSGSRASSARHALAHRARGLAHSPRLTSRATHRGSFWLDPLDGRVSEWRPREMASSRSGPPYSPPMLALIFDLDGTLVDTVYAHVYAWQRALLEIDLPSTAGGSIGGSG